MKIYFKITALALMFVAFSGGIVLAAKITVQHEVSPEMQQQDVATINDVKENRLSSKRIKVKMNAGSTDFKGIVNEPMLKYRQFNDGEGDAKPRDME
jgi:hypothetical protein